MSHITSAQQAQLLKPINPSRVKNLDGTHHLEAWDVRAHLIRVFGFGGFSIELMDCVQVYEQDTTTRAGKAAYKVGYRATVKLTIHSLNAVYTAAAFGESIMPDFKRGDTHDMAIKTAESQALKRAAMNLGTQFGLSLYNDGSMLDVVRATLVGCEDDDTVTTTAETASVVTDTETVNTTTDTMALSLVDVATPEQIHTITVLRDAMGFTDEVFLKGVRDAIKEPSITDIATLTSEQASVLITRLSKAAEAKQAA